MTRRQAIEMDNELKDYLQSYASSLNVDSNTGSYLVDNFIEFIPEEDIKGMIFLGRNPVSYKVGNVRIDLKKAFTNAVEYAAAVNKPESAFGIIQLIILSVLFVYKSIKKELSGLEAYVVYFLHTQGAYILGIEEEQFIREFLNWYQREMEREEEKRRVVEAINHLCELKIVDFQNGNIVLKEKVWGKL